MKVTETCENCGQFPIDANTLVEYVSKNEVIYSTKCSHCGHNGPNVVMKD